MSAQQATGNALEKWQQAMQAVCGDYQTRLASTQALFIGEVCAKEHAGFTLAQVKTNAGLISRSSNADRDDDRYCFLVSQRRGSSRITQHGLTLQLSPGDLILMDSVGACEINPQGLMEHASLHLPRAEVARTLRYGRPLFGKVSAGCSSGRMLRVLMDQLYLHEEDQHAPAGENAALLSAFSSLLGAALGQPEPPAHGAQQAPGSHLHSQVRQLIEETLHHPNLTPHTLASRLQVSVRQLYRLFEEHGDSVCRYIQRMRLQRSAADLRNPNLRHQSITTIAFKWGFSDAAHFSRAFKKHFALAPKDYRAAALMH